MKATSTEEVEVHGAGQGVRIRFSKGCSQFHLVVFYHTWQLYSPLGTRSGTVVKHDAFAMTISWLSHQRYHNNSTQGRVSLANPQLN